MYPTFPTISHRFLAIGASVAPPYGGGDLSPPNPKSQQTLSKKNSIKLVSFNQALPLD